MRGQQDGVIRRCADVADLVDPDLAVVALEEGRQCFGGLLFFLGDRGNRDELGHQLSALGVECRML